MSPRKPRRWRKDFPYYKIQLFSPIFNSWTDQTRAYGSLEEAERIIQDKFPDQKGRIVVVERTGRRVLEE